MYLMLYTKYNYGHMKLDNEQDLQDQVEKSTYGNFYCRVYPILKSANTAYYT